MKKFLLSWICLLMLATACASEPAEENAAADEPTAQATSEPTVAPAVQPSPTAVIIETSTPVPDGNDRGDDTDADAGDEPLATPVPTSEAPTATPEPTTAVPTATPRPIPTAVPTATPPPRPTTLPTAVPPTATPIPTAIPTATPSPVQIGCTISKRDIGVGEIITLTAQQSPARPVLSFAFDHGDGTIDQTPESFAFYREPGTYEVRLQWRSANRNGAIPCGAVTVRSSGPTPTPTPTPTPPDVQIGCTISIRRPIVVGELIVFTAVQDPTDVAVTYAFDHGDGTIDITNRSVAFYEAPGAYEVRLQWVHSGTSGTILCGTVQVEADFNASNYLGKTQAQAEAFAAADNFIFRIGRIDDQVFVLTQEYLSNRVTVEIDSGIVTSAARG